MTSTRHAIVRFALSVYKPIYAVVVILDAIFSLDRCERIDKSCLNSGHYYTRTFITIRSFPSIKREKSQQNGQIVLL